MMIFYSAIELEVDKRPPFLLRKKACHGYELQND